MLSEVIGDLLPTALGVAFSPFPVVAVVLILGTPRARTNGPLFALGWVVGLSALTAAVVLLGSAVDDSAADTGIAWGKVAGGVLLLGLAVRKWTNRPRGDEEPTMPAWMSALDEVGPRKALVLGLGLAVANPKNIVLTVAGAASIPQAGLTGGDAIAAVAVFVALGSITVAGSVVAYLVATERAAPALAGLKDFMVDNETAIMVVVLVLIGAKLLGDGLGVLG